MRYALWPGFALLLIVAGCGIIETMHMAPPVALSGIDPLLVKQMLLPPSKPLSFGPWQAGGYGTDADKKKCKATGFLSGKQEVETIRRYRFKMAAPLAPEYELHAECETISRSVIHRSLANIYGDSDGYPRLHCKFDGSDSGELDIARYTGGFEFGTASFNGHIWGVRPVTESSSGIAAYHSPYGYEMVDADVSVIGAVETVNGGRVWIKPSTTQNDTRLATVFTALLLYFPYEVDPDKDCKSK